MTDLPPPELYAPRPIEPREMLDWQAGDLLHIERVSGSAQLVAGYSAELEVGDDDLWVFTVFPMRGGQWFTASWFQSKMRMSWASDTVAEAMVWGQQWADDVRSTEESA